VFGEFANESLRHLGVFLQNLKQFTLQFGSASYFGEDDFLILVSWSNWRQICSVVSALVSDTTKNRSSSLAERESDSDRSEICRIGRTNSCKFFFRAAWY
jgi:hypothetical protein